MAHKMQTWNPREDRWQDVPNTEGSLKEVALRVALECAAFKRGVDTESGEVTVYPKMHAESITAFLGRHGVQLVEAA